MAGVGMGLELRMMRAVTTRLPRVRGAGFLTHTLMRLYLRKPRPPVDAGVLGFKMCLDPSEFVDRALLFYPQFWDPQELGFLARHLRPGDVFLDVGAHIGLYSLAASRAVGRDGLVLAIEADPHTYRRLRRHLRANRIENVRAVNVGVSDRTEVLRLGIDSGGNNAANSFLRQTDHGIEVGCRPLLDVLREHHVAAVHGAKFDIEGYEYRVLDRFLADAGDDLRPGFIILEFHPTWVEMAGGDALALLTSHGYRIHARHDLNYILVDDRTTVATCEL